MRKFTALILVLAMLLVSVCAFAEETAEPILEGETELTDEVNEAEEAAEDLAEQELAEADDTVSTVEAALDSDRKIVAELSLTANDEAFAAANGLNVVVSGQNNGVNRFTFDVSKAGDQLAKGEISYADEKLYFRLNALGEKTYSLDASGMSAAVDTILDFLNLSNPEVVDESLAKLGKLAPTSLLDFDYTQLHLDPLFPVIYQLRDCVTIIDVPDYELGVSDSEETALEGEVDAADTAEIPAEGEASEPILNVEDGIEASGTDVAMVVNVVLTHDDMAILINAIAATIEANSEIAAACGLNAEEFTQYAETMLDRFDEDIAIILGLDSFGDVVYGSMDYSLEYLGSYRLQYTREAEEEGVHYTVEQLMTGEDNTSYVPASSMDLYLTDVSMLVRVVVGDPADSAIGAEFSYLLPSEGSNEYQFTFNTLSVENNIASFPCALLGEGTFTQDGVDFAADGTLTLTLNESESPAFAANVSVKTEAADVIDFSDAVNINEMEVGEDADLWGTLLTSGNTEISE